jgi:hypothetical protein
MLDKYDSECNAINPYSAIAEQSGSNELQLETSSRVERRRRVSSVLNWVQSSRELQLVSNLKMIKD